MKNNKLIEILLLSYLCIASVSSVIITPALPIIQKQFQVSNALVDWLVTAFLIGYLFGQLIYAPIANAYGRLTALRIGLKINLLGILISLIAIYFNHFYLLIFSRFITALGAASGLACTFMLINEWLPEDRRAQAMASAILSFALGIGLTLVLGGFISEVLGWQYCFILLLIHGLIMYWGVNYFDETLTVAKPIQFQQLISDYKMALSSPKLVSYALLQGYASAFSYAFSAAAPHIAYQDLHLSPDVYGMWNILNIIGMLLGGLTVKKMVKTIQLNQLIKFGFMGMLIFISANFAMIKFNIHLPLLFFIGSAGMYVFSSYIATPGSMIASTAISDKASASSMMSFLNIGFAALSVILMGLLPVTIWSAFALLLLILGVALFVLTRFVKIDN